MEVSISCSIKSSGYGKGTEKLQIRVIDFLPLHSMSWDLEYRSKECLPSLPNERVGSDGAIFILFFLRCDYSNLSGQG